MKSFEDLEEDAKERIYRISVIALFPFALVGKAVTYIFPRLKDKI